MDTKVTDLSTLPCANSPPLESVLARHFVALMREDIGRAPLHEQLQPTASLAAFGLDDEDDFEFENARKAETTLTVDLAAMTILLASSLEGRPSLLRSLRKEAPVVIVQVPEESLMAEAEIAIRACVLGRAVQVVPQSLLEAGRVDLNIFERRTAIILVYTGEKRSRETMRSKSTRALSLDLPFVAVSSDTARSVPDPVRALSDATLVLAGWKASSLALLLEAVTGEEAEIGQESWIASVTIDDLRSSISRNRGAPGSLERLRRTVQKRLAAAPSVPKLEDLAGYGEARQVGLDLVSDLCAYREGRIGWSSVDPGFLLAGPPGTGKTLYAASFARSADLPFFVGSLAEWQSTGHMGDCLAAMRRSFAEARAAAPSVLFIDEIDSFGDRASFGSQHRDYSIQIVNGLLEQLDGAGDREGVVVVAATNYVRRIDPAILRAGRLDRIVHIQLPDTGDLVAILKTQLGDDLHEEELLPVALAGAGATGADCASWVRRARGVARRSGRPVELTDLLDAASAGRPPLSDEDIRRVSFHEAGHAICIAALDLGTVADMTIHAAGGTTRVAPPSQMTTRREAIATLVNLLGGREAERLLMGSISAGAGGRSDSDLAFATRVAFSIETSWGLGETGPIWVADDGELPSHILFSPAMSPVHRLLRHAEAEAARLVLMHRPSIERLAARLREDGYLDADGVSEAIGPIGSFDLMLASQIGKVDASAA